MLERLYRINIRKCQVTIRILKDDYNDAGNISVLALTNCLRITYKDQAIPYTFKYNNNGDFEMILLNVPNGLPCKIVLRSGHTLVPFLKDVTNWFAKEFLYSKEDMRKVVISRVYPTKYNIISNKYW